MSATGIGGEVWTTNVDAVAPVEVGDGCRRRDLPSVPDVRAWIVDIAPGSEWPHVDTHPDGEDVFVVAGELIEGGRRFGAGDYLHFAPGSAHRPRSETGVRLIGWNPRPRAAAEPRDVPAPSPASVEHAQHRVLFDFEIAFANGGGLAGHDFRLDIDGDAIGDDALAALLVRDLRLLMVASVSIGNKRIVAEAHKRGA